MSEQAPPRTGLHVMSKPIGPICNLDCEYCYYLHKTELYPSTQRWRMQDPTLDEYIRQYIEAQPRNSGEITFAWQGGEPTLLGLPFFRRIIQLQQQHRRPGDRIVNTLQTNGLLLNDEWCEFIQEHGFLIGLSIDGPRDLHDRFRYDRQGNGSFDQVLSALQKLKSFDIDFNALVVVNRVNGNEGRRVYSYLRDNGVEHLQFIPIVERRGTGVHPETETLPEDRQAWSHLVSSRSVQPEQFGRFLIDVFDEWVQRDVGRVFVQIFDQALSAWMDVEPSLCVFRRRCGKALALEHNGDLYSCDHFVEPEYRLGNIHDLPILDMAESDVQQQFGAAKETSLPEYCRQCEVQFVCNGECPKNRFIETPTGDPGLNYLCAGYRLFFNHVRPIMEAMRDELRQRRPAANVMHRLREQRRKRSSELGGTVSARTGPPRTGPVGRNDPCPCGSGRKFKKCCQSR